VAHNTSIRFVRCARSSQQQLHLIAVTYGQNRVVLVVVMNGFPPTKMRARTA